jgi:predicted alpha/beta superfamily hydrolase
MGLPGDMMTLKIAEWQDYRLWRGGGFNTVVGDLLILPDVFSPQLQNQRDILVLLPPSYHQEAGKRYPVIYMQDGQNLFDRATGFAGNEWEVDETMLKLADEGLEAIIVGLPNTPQRFPEYNPFPHTWGGRGDSYLTFIVETVKPLVDQAFRTRLERQHTGLMGSSMGGLISLYGFFQRSDVFGLAGVMSPSLWVGAGAIYRYVAQQPFVAGKIYLDNGTREQSARKMNAELVHKGYTSGRDLLYVAEPDGEHHEAAWARRLPDALRFLLSD